MSDRELRQVLSDVMDDIDNGRLVLRRGRRLRNFVTGSALAAGLMLGGCTNLVPAYGAPVALDAQPDTGATDAYGIPMMDAEPTADASVAEYYDGTIHLHGVPPAPEDEGEDE